MACECRQLGDVWTFNIRSLEWKRIELAGPAPLPREMATGTMVSPGRMLVLGGRGANGDILNDAAVLALDAGCWQAAAQHAGFGRCCHAACKLPPEGEAKGVPTTTTRVLMFGGFNGSGLCNDVVRRSHAQRLISSQCAMQCVHDHRLCTCSRSTHRPSCAYWQEGCENWAADALPD